MAHPMMPKPIKPSVSGGWRVSGSERGVECKVALSFMIMTVGAITPMLWAQATAPQVRRWTPLGIGIGARGCPNALQFTTARNAAWCGSPLSQPMRQMTDRSRGRRHLALPGNGCGGLGRQERVAFVAGRPERMTPAHMRVHGARSRSRTMPFLAVMPRHACRPRDPMSKAGSLKG